MRIKLAESIILNAFKNEPFHTLYFLYDFLPLSSSDGGTCSDKVLSVKEHLEQENYTVQLHSSIINQQECHRLLKIVINNREYFADVGNGWPSIKLFPAFEAVTYRCYGIIFNSRIFSDHIKIYQTRNSTTKHTLTIPLKSKPEDKIMADISCRFNKSYPFSGKLRFAQIVNDKFLFLRDSELHIYSESGQKVKACLFMNNLNDILKHEFNFDLNRFLHLKAE